MTPAGLEELAQELVDRYTKRQPVAALHAANSQEEVMNDLKYLNPIDNPPVGARFHWRDQWFFQRTRLGAVLVTLPDHSQKVIPPHEWASIVASVSRAGETGETWRAALDVHGEVIE